MTQVYL